MGNGIRPWLLNSRYILNPLNGIKPDPAGLQRGASLKSHVDTEKRSDNDKKTKHANFDLNIICKLEM